ncbi:MAG: hypothetical protein JWN24_2894 [Phycisphaerales bacterium]|nr:hypothetical protein [Phycisphaerales bacterium]
MPIKSRTRPVDGQFMGDLFRGAVYPVLLVSIVGGLWLLAASQGDLCRKADAGLPALPPIHYTDPPDPGSDDPKPAKPELPGIAETDR